MTTELTSERANELLSYDPETGELRWKVKRSNRNAGQLAGYFDGVYQGYWHIRIDRKLYQSHNVIWLMVTGEWPILEVDHKDRDRGNNCWLNLRQATSSQNRFNSSMQSNNTSGYRGVCWDKSRGVYLVQINHSGKREYKRFLTVEDAVAWRRAKAKELFGEFYNES